jgi:hypothetical protein
MAMPDRSADLHDFISRVDQAATDFGDQIGTRPLTPGMLVMGHSLTRCIRLFRSIRLLASRGYGLEAAVLARSFLEEVFRLQQLAAADEERRQALALGHLTEAAEHARRLAKRSREAKLDIADEHWEGQARKVEERAQRYGKGHGVEPQRFAAPRTFASESKDASAKRNLFEMEVLNFFAHGSALVRGFSEMKQGEVATIGAPAQAVPIDNLVLLQAADYLIQGVRAAATFLRVAAPTFDRLAAELDEAAEKLLATLGGPR